MPNNTDIGTIKINSNGFSYYTIDPTSSPIWSSSTTEFNLHFVMFMGETDGGGFLDDAWSWATDHFYIGVEGEISYGVQLSGIVYKGAGLNINPGSQVVAEGGISNRGSYVNSYPIVPASQMDKGKALDFGVAWIVGGNYNWNIENGKYISSTASLGVYGFGGNITWDNSGVTNLFIGFELSGKAAAGWGAAGSGKIGFIWNW